MNKEVKGRLSMRWKANKSEPIKVIIGNREMNESRLKSRRKHSNRRKEQENDKLRTEQVRNAEK